MNSSKPCVPAADDAFGPQVQYCRDGFDFTLFFEQVIFTIVPVTILLVASPFRILHLLRQPVVLSGRSMVKFQVAKSVRDIPW
jgi:ATP-binding cassette subfamily C (CFTR/MRP) protein 1